jgi:hypothetical protein
MTRYSSNKKSPPNKIWSALVGNHHFRDYLDSGQVEGSQKDSEWFGSIMMFFAFAQA